MKIVEALKRLRVIEKRINENKQEIVEYASIPSTEKPVFESEEKQQQEVNARIQSNEDLVKEYMKLKKDIEYTNLKIEIMLMDQKWAISDLLVIQRKLGDDLISTYKSLNDTNAQRRIKEYHFGRRDISSSGQQVNVFPQKFYNEKQKNEKIRYWSDFLNEISSRLEVVNATTDIIEFE